MTRITRVEVIDENGRSYANWEDDNDVSWQFQDNGRTLKVFVNKVKEEPKTLFDIIQNLGYSVDACYEIVDAVEEFEKSKEVEKLQEKEWNIKVVTDYLTGKSRHKLNIVDKDGNDYKPEPITTEELLKPKWEPKPQTEEQVEEGLRSAMRKAKEDGVFDEPKESWMDKPIDELVDKLMENPPDCLKFQLGKTLEQIITRWWEDTFTTHEKWSVEECIDDLIDQVELWFPREQSSEGSQDIYAVVAVEAHNDLLKKIKSKLRNKKDT